eukprot:9339360-Alexandrium_andersonii.AAC.1
MISHRLVKVPDSESWSHAVLSMFCTQNVEFTTRFQRPAKQNNERFHSMRPMSWIQKISSA